MAQRAPAPRALRRTFVCSLFRVSAARSPSYCFKLLDCRHHSSCALHSLSSAARARTLQSTLLARARFVSLRHSTCVRATCVRACDVRACARRACVREQHGICNCYYATIRQQARNDRELNYMHSINNFCILCDLLQ